MNRMEPRSCKAAAAAADAPRKRTLEDNNENNASSAKRMNQKNQLNVSPMSHVSFARQLSMDSSDSDDQSDHTPRMIQIHVPQAHSDTTEIDPCPLLPPEAANDHKATTPGRFQDEQANSTIEVATKSDAEVKPEQVAPIVVQEKALACSKSSFEPRTSALKKLVLFVVWMVATWWSTADNGAVVDPDSVYVPGAGFSGFWFTLGRLQSISNPRSKSYYCFSAGCLGVVATLSNHSITDVVGMALHIQEEYMAGTTERTSVTANFANALVETAAAPQNCNLVDNSTCCCTMAPIVGRPLQDPELLSRIHVITTVRNGWFGWKTQIRSPKNIEQLKEMLVQTTWIPFATGGSVWQTDSETGQQHMDGGMTAVFHPKCQHFLGLPLHMPSLLLNFLNVNLGLEQAVAFWKAGVSMGL